MPLTATSIGLIITIAVLGCFPSIGAENKILPPGVIVRFTCTGPPYQNLPTWYLNGSFAAEGEENRCYRLNFPEDAGNETIATLTIYGNLTCDTFNIYCTIQVSEFPEFRNLHNISLRFQGHLSSPENVHINEPVNTSITGPVIEWKPPYSSMNNEKISVDPRITQYTVYITDNYTGDVVKENVTETQFTFNNQGNVLCPMYRVSAWNSGSEGQLSEPVQESTPRVPRNVTVESVTVRGTVTTNVVHIHINNVDVVCTSRIPEFFLITVLTSGGSVLRESTRQHQPGQAVADFTISLPQSVDVCSLHVRISAGNGAGMSAPSEVVEVDCSGDSTDSTTTTASATTVLTATSTESGSEGGRQQGNIITTLIVTITIGVIAAVGVTLIVTVGIICCLKHKSKNSKDPADSVDNSNSESPSLSGPVQLYKPQILQVLYEPTASRPIARDLQGTRELTQSSDSAESSHTTDSEGSSHSDDPLLQSRPVAYTQVNVQQTQVPPPANDDHVQYAQLKQPDKL